MMKKENLFTFAGRSKKKKTTKQIVNEKESCRNESIGEKMLIRKSKAELRRRFNFDLKCHCEFPARSAIPSYV